MRMVVAGLGYSGSAIAAEAAEAGFAVAGTAREPRPGQAPQGVALVRFAEAGAAIRQATHLVVTAAPEEAGCPVLATHAEAIAAAPGLRWLGYLSTTGVYGDRGGAEVDEATPPAPGQARSVLRLRAEEAWRAVAAARGLALDLFRVGGIYGPGRSPLDDLRRGTARRVVKPGHAFSRIHRDDIALAVVTAARQGGQGIRVLHLVDDEPAPNEAVIAEAARLLGLPPPPAIPFEEAARGMSAMALSFWAENRRVANAKTKAALGLAWRCPTYREGLARILAAG
ncbi:Rossmann-fold NAD(P)-binding domain-containing protein [Falsiroseomonas tokyonensis]|uniref:SDR family NAD(P)-dependent oxidoreductase n=1 Tax=Falsiroseomonas tokyonensis TaxID=430521 RepID=A0ABV7BPG2_9PROT|nr:SDR family NAD(P)-dependent oxidoreductase [Falsiroseomonas tokyonensis]